MESLFWVGLILIFIGILLLFLSLILSTEKKKVEGGFIFFIGPIPIGFATSKVVFFILLIFSLTILIIFLILLKIF